MYLSYRRNVIAGPLIALIIIPATTAAGIFMVLGEWSNAGTILAKAGMEFLIVIVVGIILIWVKQQLVHKRKALH